MNGYRAFYEIADTSTRNSYHKFFKDGAARRAALAAVRAQDAGGGREAIIDALADSLNRDSHICYFDDPCDDFYLKVV
jgi:hypothetical protein